MATINEKARQAIQEALRDNAALFERFQEDKTLPQRLRAQFSTQRHVNATLAEAIEDADRVDIIFAPVPGVSSPDGQKHPLDVKIQYNAPIWE